MNMRRAAGWVLLSTLTLATRVDVHNQQAGAGASA